MKEVPEEIQRLLKQVADHFDEEDCAVRERQIRTWRHLKLYWGGFKTWYSEVAHDWRIYDEQSRDSDNAYYDKPINVFRAYLESIIAALSIAIPSIKCFPDDADNPLDLSTAKAGDKIAELIYKHNDVVLLWLHALYIYCTEGMIACYSYPKEDESYGTYDEKKYENSEEMQYQCPACQTQLEDSLFTNREIDEFMPDEDDVELHNLILNEDEIICPECGMLLDPTLQKTPLVVSRLVGITKHPKSRQCMEVYGGLYVKVPNYAMKQADIPYLRFSYETHFSNAIERYDHLREKLGKISPSASGIYDPYEAWGRLSPQYHGEYPINTTTINNYWFRSCAFNVLNEDDAKILKAKFPDGCKYVKINENFAEAENENLDDCWTLTHNPLSDYLHHDPLGMLLTSVQDVTNDLIALVLATVEHGIPQTFADPAVLNFGQYNTTEVNPGDIFPAKPASGKSMGDAFYEVKTATLSAEILPFAQKIQELGQLVSGALPSLFGGSPTAGSKTASEYSMSRAQSQQRLQTTWKMLTIWWKNIFGKVIPAYIKDVAEDERNVEKDEVGNFVNVFIRKAELQGKIGKIELEASEQLPITWGQIKDTVMKLFELNNPEVLEALSAPENITLLKTVIGLNDFTVPGESDRQKQYEEIKQLMDSEPIPSPDGMEMPSVEIDPLLDDHQIEADVTRRWLVSEAGRLAKVENQTGYKNVLLHYKAHMDIISQNMMAQQMMMQPPVQQGESNGGSPDGQTIQ